MGTDDISLRVVDLVPHAPPMVLLDRIVSAGEEDLCAEMTIREDSLFFADGGVGAWVGVEYMAQAVAAHAGYLARRSGEPVRAGFLLGTRKYECECDSFTPGSVLRIRVKRLLAADNGIGSYGCGIEEGDRKLAQATLTVFQPADIGDFFKKESGSE